MAADHVVDMGPRAGVHGGRIVASGTPEDIKSSTASLTGAYLSGRQAHRGAEEPAAVGQQVHLDQGRAGAQPAQPDGALSRRCVHLRDRRVAGRASRRW